MLLSSRFNNLTPIITLPGGDLDAESPSDSEGEKGEDELHLMGAALEREFLGLGDWKVPLILIGTSCNY